jgi:hypothetical protein
MFQSAFWGAIFRDLILRFLAVQMKEDPEDHGRIRAVEDSERGIVLGVSSTPTMKIP